MRLFPRINRGGMFLVSIAFLGAAGCGASTGTITGKVTFKNTPLKGGTVSFVSADKQTSKSGPIQEDGSYTVEKVPPGEAIICVETTSVGPPPGVPGYAAPAGMENPNATTSTDRAQQAKRYVFIPPRYAEPEQSGLKYTVKSGTQEKNINLE